MYATLLVFWETISLIDYWKLCCVWSLIGFWWTSVPQNYGYRKRLIEGRKGKSISQSAKVVFVPNHSAWMGYGSWRILMPAVPYKRTQNSRIVNFVGRCYYLINGHQCCFRFAVWACVTHCYAIRYFFEDFEKRLFRERLLTSW